MTLKKETNQLFYSDIVRYAQHNKGRLITREITFIKSCKILQFECEKGHRWEVSLHCFNPDFWCSICSGNTKPANSIMLMKKIAKERGGKCLSRRYVNSDSRLKWECSNGHQWFSNAHSVKNKKSWCQKCKCDAQKNTIENMKKLARKEGGRCISKKYKLNSSPLEWECGVGHKWTASPTSVLSGKWCPICKKESENLIKLKEVKAIAKKRGGKCLSDIYVDTKSYLSWKCKNGHCWEAPAVRITHLDSWCPFCAGNMKKSLEDVRQLAIEQEGKLLSKSYINSKSPLRWKCKNGHIFNKALSDVVSKSSWCSLCKKNKL